MAQPGNENRRRLNPWKLVTPAVVLVFWIPVLWWLGFFGMLKRFFVAIWELMFRPVNEIDLIIAALICLLLLILFRRRKPETTHAITHFVESPDTTDKGPSRT